MFKVVNNEFLLNLVNNFTALQDVHSYHIIALVAEYKTNQKFDFLFTFCFKSFSCLAQNQSVFCNTKFWSELNDNLKQLTMIC